MKPQPVPTRAELVDEFVRLDAELALVKPKLKRLETLKETIRGWYRDAKPEETFTESGTIGAVVLGPKENQRKVDVARAVKVLKAKGALAIATITVKALEAVLGADKAAECIVTDRTGSRDLKPVPLPAEMREAA